MSERHSRPAKGLKTTSHLILALASTFAATDAHAQCTVPSSNGYTVTATVVPVELIPSTTNCQWGYNYNVKLAYEVTFSGNNVPASMWTLQGNVICGGQSLFFNLPNNGGTGLVTTTSNPWRGIPDCNTAHLGTLACFRVDLIISGPGISYQTTECAFSPLPVELTSFDARAMNDEVHLTWRTASERNSGHFVVERSKDGTHFEPILRVDAAGHSVLPVDYAAVDHHPMDGISYYKLRQVDADGLEHTGGWTSVEMKGRPKQVAVHPNPNTGQRIVLRDVPNGSLLRLHDTSGTIVHETLVNGPELDLPPLSPGVYIGSTMDPQGRPGNFRYVQL